MSARLRCCLIAVCVGLAACAPAGDTDQAALETDTLAKASSPAITQQDVENGAAAIINELRAGNGAAAGSHYAQDAMLINARGKFDGNAAITEFWTQAAANNAGQGLTLQPVKWGTSGDLAYSVHRYTGGITAPSGHVVAVVQRQADGTLKTVVQVSIPDAPR